MFGTIDSFTKQFAPHEGGYLFYPGRRSGGKLVSESEYQVLVANWQSVAGAKGTFKTVAGVVLIIILGIVAEALINGGGWIESISVWAAVAFAVVRIAWAAFASSRLVKGRPDVAPPRTPDENRKLAKAMIPWSMVIFLLIVTTGSFVASLTTTPQSLLGWSWPIGSGVLSAAYLWIAIQKFRDGKQV